MKLARDDAEAVEKSRSMVERQVGQMTHLLDLGMPKLNGFDTCRRFRELPCGQNIIIVACTGWGQEEDRQKSKEAGFDFHLVKPVDIDAIQKLLANLQLTKQ